MRKPNLVFLLVVIFFIISCDKEEYQLAESEIESSKTDLALSSRYCTPSASDYEYTDSYTLSGVGLDCIPELILDANIQTYLKGRWVLSASCHLNDKGTEEFSMTGTGSVSGHTYSLQVVQNYHVNLNFSGQVKSASVFHGFDDVVITNETTGETYGGLKLKSHLTFDANGEPTAVDYEFIECN